MKCSAVLQSETADKHRTACYTEGKDKYILYILACVLEDSLLVSAVADNLHKLQSHSFSKTKLAGRQLCEMLVWWGVLVSGVICPDIRFLWHSHLHLTQPLFVGESCLI